MTRLQSELHRLYLPQSSDAASGVRAAVLTLARPADWTAMSVVWRGVQADFGLPAPAIAVNGVDGFQLWFSLAEPVLATQALGFIDALRARYLGEIASQRLGLTSTVDAMPPQATLSGQWSAFVAADLAPVFADEPWLDIVPNPDGQADVLCRLQPINSADFQAALAQLGPTPTPNSAGPASLPLTPSSEGVDAETFLRQVMNDDSVALGLRIEAATALLTMQGRHDAK
jgi:hypothetical protein